MKKIAGAVLVAIIVAAALAYSGLGQTLINAPQQIARDAGETLNRLQSDLATVSDEMSHLRHALSKVPTLHRHGFHSLGE
jgi:hypothetical protein